MAAPPAKNPRSMSIIVLFSAAVLSLTSAAISPGPPELQPSSVETCVKLLFDHPPQAPPELKRILCRDLLRSIVTSYKVTGILSPEYLAALEKLPKYKDNQTALKKFICGLSPAKKFGCKKSETRPTK